MATELVCVGLAGILLLVQILLPAFARMATSGIGWAAGPRDNPPAEVPQAAKRADRALANYRETFPVFVGAALAVVVAGVSSPVTAAGAVIYLGARIAYPFAYIVHIPLLRSAIWGVSIVGLLMVLLPLVVAGLSGGASLTAS